MPKTGVMAAILTAPKWLVLFVALVVVAATIWLDHLTGWQWDASVLYALPIVLVAFRADWLHGLLFAALGAAAGGWHAWQEDPYTSGVSVVLALFSRLFALSMVVIAVAMVKSRWQLGLTQIEMLKTTQDLEEKILWLSEREQERIGRELHDGLCQTLAGIAALSAAQSCKLAGQSQPEASAGAAEITQLLNAAVAETRDIVRGLGPVGLAGADLPAALAQLAVKTERDFRVACIFENPHQVSSLGPETEGHLFRIAQEAVTNALTHGRAGRIDISLGHSDGGLVLQVRDDGAGIAEAARHVPGIGLRSMAYRAEAIGASFEVRPGQRRGTVVTCSVPMRPHPGPA